MDEVNPPARLLAPALLIYTGCGDTPGQDTHISWKGILLLAVVTSGRRKPFAIIIPGPLQIIPLAERDAVKRLYLMASKEVSTFS